ncbi:MAG: hypothetical protein GKS05_05205 [Nitrospirales bacterium]|nr:hypothetical protein [Nitrospirales bacterium]
MGATLFIGSMVIVLSGIGLIMAVAPTAWIAFLDRSLHDAWIRFLVTHGMILVGLTLIVGTQPFQLFWFWAICGAILVAKACLLLGASESLRIQFSALIGKWPTWAFRIYGVLLLIFSGFLATQVIVYG